MLSKWVKDGCKSYAITILENEMALKNNLFWNGHGLLVVDALREIALIPHVNKDIDVRIATIHDLKALIYLMSEHQQYMKQTPTFLYSDEQDDIEEEILTILKDDNQKIFLLFIIVG